MGGFVGTIDQWAGVDLAWRARLAEPILGKPPLKKFGLANCASRQGEFLDYSLAECDMLRKAFRDIIIDSDVVGLSYAVDFVAWEKLVAGVARKHFGTAEMMCFGGCITGAVEAARLHHPDQENISLHFDKGRRSTDLQRLIDIVDANYQGIPHILRIAFDDVVSFPPLQAADMIATESRWFAQRSLGSAYQSMPTPHFRRFLESVRATGYMLDAEMIQKTLKDNGF